MAPGGKGTGALAWHSKPKLSKWSLLIGREKSTKLDGCTDTGRKHEVLLDRG